LKDIIWRKDIFKMFTTEKRTWKFYKRHLIQLPCQRLISRLKTSFFLSFLTIVSNCQIRKFRGKISSRKIPILEC
jgi:hypothetical protein